MIHVESIFYNKTVQKFTARISDSFVEETTEFYVIILFLLAEADGIL